MMDKWTAINFLAQCGCFEAKKLFIGHNMILPNSAKAKPQLKLIFMAVLALTFFLSSTQQTGLLVKQ
jgi:hypothetical protein